MARNECDDKCIYYPPSSLDGKPCCVCDPDDIYLNCKREKDEEDES